MFFKVYFRQFPKLQPQRSDEEVYKKRSCDPARGRTWNLLIRSQTCCPLRHRVMLEALYREVQLLRSQGITSVKDWSGPAFISRFHCVLPETVKIILPKRVGSAVNIQVSFHIS